MNLFIFTLSIFALICSDAMVTHKAACPDPSDSSKDSKHASLSMCSSASRLASVASEAFRETRAIKTKPIRTHLDNFVIQLQDHLKHSLSESKTSLHSVLGRGHEKVYVDWVMQLLHRLFNFQESNKDHYSEQEKQFNFYDDFRLKKPKSIVEKFMGELKEQMFVLLDKDQDDFDPECTRSILDNLKLFDKTREELNLLLLVKALSKGMQETQNIMNLLTETSPSPECLSSLTRLSQCPLCLMDVEQVEPCHHYCIDVMRQCIGIGQGLSHFWNELITELVKTVKLSSSILSESSVEEIVAHFVSINDDVIKRVKEQCGPPGQLEKGEGRFNFSASIGSKGNLERETTSKVNQKELLSEISSTLSFELTDFWPNLASELCVNNLDVSNCWNGSHIGSYNSRNVNHDYNDNEEIERHIKNIKNLSQSLKYIRKYVKNEEKNDKNVDKRAYSGSGEDYYYEGSAKSCDDISDDEDCFDQSGSGSGQDDEHYSGNPGDDNNEINIDISVENNEENFIIDDFDLERGSSNSLLRPQCFVFMLIIISLM